MLILQLIITTLFFDKIHLLQVNGTGTGTEIHFHVLILTQYIRLFVRTGTSKYLETTFFSGRYKDDCFVW